MNIIFLLGNYLNNKSANSICAENIFHEWEKDGDSIHVICPGKITQIIEKSHTEIVHCFSYFHKKNWVECRSFVDKMQYLFYRLKDYFIYPRTDTNMIKSYVYELEQICACSNIDLIVSVCNPPETVEAVYKFVSNKRGIKWAIYDIDTVSNCSLGKIDRYIGFIIKNKAFNWEKKVFNRADLVIHLPQHSNHFEKKCYNNVKNKMVILDLPLLKIDENDVYEDNSGEDDIMVYAGRFYPVMRDPELFIPMLLDALDKLHVRIQIYTDEGYCKKISEKYLPSEILFVSNYISEEKLRKIINKSKFVISLGNRGTEMFPSKIVTYVGTCKPIIHFYQDDNDPVIDFLDSYPDKLLLNLNCDAADNRNKLRDYILSEHKQIDKKDVLMKYQTNIPQTIAKNIKIQL